jgi:hypothetical protein
MYLSSSQQCSYPNSLTPTNPNNGPVDLANVNRINTQVAIAQAGWTPLYARQWQDFANLGAPVAFQVMNAPVGLNPTNPTVPLGPTDNSGGSPVGVVTPGSPVSTGAPGSNSNGGGNGGGAGVVLQGSPGNRNRWAGTKRQRPITQTQVDFAQRFGAPGGPMFPWKTYLGPLPNQGSVLSLAYGGLPSNRQQSSGTPPAMPNPLAAIPASTWCTPNGPGVQATPYGEPDYSAVNSAAGSPTVTDGTGVAMIVGGLLLLAAIAFGGEKHSQYRARRKKAA